MKGKRSLALLLGMVLLCALLSGCAEKLTPAERYGHLRDRYIIYDSFIYVVEGGEEPSQEFVQAREALIMARYDEAYAGFEALAGAADSDLERARCLNGMAVTQAIQSRYAACNELFEQALSAYEGLEESNEAETAICMQNKAIMLYDQMLLDDARILMEEAMVAQRKLPSGHPDHAVLYLTYGQLIGDLETIREGEIYTIRAHTCMRAVFGEEDLLAITCESGRYWTLRGGQKEWLYGEAMVEARDFYPRYLEAVRVEYGEEHPLVGMAYSNIGQMYLKLNNITPEAIEYLDKAEKILTPVYNGVHYKIHHIKASKVIYYDILEEYELSLRYNAEASYQLEQIQMYGLQDKFYASGLGNIANNYIYMDEREKSVDYILRQSYIFKTYWDKEPTPNTMELLERYYNEYNLGDQPFEEWYDEQMAYHAAHEDEPMIVEGYEYLYE